MGEPFAEGEALGMLTAALYADLRRLARAQRGRLHPGATLQTTALVNEAYLKLSRGSGYWQSRDHFLNTAALAMRHVLVNYARDRVAAKRGNGVAPLELDEEILILKGEKPEDVIALDAALDKLRALNPRLVAVVECRFFAGYTDAETAQLLDVSERTVRSDWATARAWLYRELHHA